LLEHAIQSEHLTLACCLFTLSKENFIFPILSLIFAGKTLAVTPQLYWSHKKNPWIVSMTVL